MSAFRPTSLFKYDLRQPEKEPLEISLPFNIELNKDPLYGANKDIIHLFNQIKEVGKNYLYRWKTFPIVLPPLSDAIQPAHGSLASNEEIPYITGGHDESRHYCTNPSGLVARPPVEDLFSFPSFDEVDAIAMDPHGESYHLNSKQLKSISEQGEFEVASLNFPGQMYRWRLSPLLQIGVLNTYHTLYSDMALALRFIVVTAKARLFSHFFSIAQALTSLLIGLTKFFDVIFGLPDLEAIDLEERLTQERSRYLVAELFPATIYEDSIERLCAFIRRMIVKHEDGITSLPVPIPYLFTTPKGIEVDLRLFNNDIMTKAIPILSEILERGSRGWFLHFREKLIFELRQQKVPDNQIEKQVNEAVKKEYFDRIASSIESDSNLQALGPDIPKLLIEHARAYILMHRAVINVQQKLKTNEESLKERLMTEHPILSKIEPWLRSEMRAAENRFKEECKWSAHEEAISLCISQQLNQIVYFLQRDLTFMREREPVLKKELKNDKKPTRNFTWKTKIWMPKNWIVEHYFHGQCEIIATVFTSRQTSITTPRSDPSQPVFVVRKEIVRTSTTRWPLWRWINYCHRTWSWTWNAMFFFGVVMPWCSPVSIRALISPEPFTPNLELSQVNGTLFPHQGSTTPTMISTLRALARHVTKQITNIDSQPDTGFIGNGVSRRAHKMWHYVGKGVFGTLGIVMIFPPVCILTSLLSFVIALTAFMWMPMVTLTLQFLMWLTWDWDTAHKEKNRYCVLMEAVLWNVLIQGIAQSILALFIACIVCPAISLSICIFGMLRFCFRMAWDKIMFHLLIKKKGRVPAADSFLVRRISGPGHDTDYYLQIRPEVALAAFEAMLELEELAVFEKKMKDKIYQPGRDFALFVNKLFGPFSTSLVLKGPFLTLVNDSEQLFNELQKKLNKRRIDLDFTKIPKCFRSKLKMTNIDLKIAIQQGALMLERFYPNHVLRHLSISEEEFWESKYLAPNDWPGLAACYYSDLFHQDFISPLDETANHFKIEPKANIDLSRYQELVVGAVGVDLLGPVYMPRTNIQVHPPYLEVETFCPFKQSSKLVDETSTAPRKPWKNLYKPYNAEKLIIPLLIPHPIQTAIIIYNRDADNPISVDCKLILNLCQNVMDKLELDDMNVPISRFRGGGGVCDSSLSSSLGSAADSAGSITAGPWSDRPWGIPPPTCVDLASPEDITLDSDSTRVVGLPLGTSV